MTNRLQVSGESENPNIFNLNDELLMLLKEYRDAQWFQENEEFLGDNGYLVEELEIALQAGSMPAGISVFHSKLRNEIGKLIVSDNFDVAIKEYAQNSKVNVFTALGTKPLNTDEIWDVVKRGLGHLSTLQCLHLSMSPEQISQIHQAWESSHENIMFGPGWRHVVLDNDPNMRLLDDVFEKHREKLDELFPDRHSSN